MRHEGISNKSPTRSLLHNQIWYKSDKESEYPQKRVHLIWKQNERNCMVVLGINMKLLQVLKIDSESSYENVNC